MSLPEVTKMEPMGDLRTVRLNPAFEWLCKPLGIMPRAARPARPQTKGRCERFGGYIRTNALIDAAIDRKLHNRADLQAVLDEWIRNTADQRRIRIGDEEATVAEFYKKSLFCSFQMLWGRV